MRSYTTIFVCIFLMCGPALSQRNFNGHNTEDPNYRDRQIPQTPSFSPNLDEYELRTLERNQRRRFQEQGVLEQGRANPDSRYSDFNPYRFESRNRNDKNDRIDCSLYEQYKDKCENQNPSSGIYNNRRQTPRETTPSYEEEEQEKPVLPNPITDFSLNLLKNIPTSSDSNLVVSPLSVQYLLAVLENGSGGKTRRQLRKVIGSKDAKTLKNVLKNDDGLKTALGIFVDGKIKLNTDYTTKISDYKPEVRNYDFSSSTTKESINEWAAVNTDNKIKDLIPQSQDLRGVQMVLATAIYFNNVWKYKFQPIGDKPFTTANGQKISTPFMEIKQNIPFMEHNFNRIDTVMISLPYENEKYEMILIVPNEKADLDTLVQQMRSEQLNTILSTTDTVYPRFTQLQMPKFNIKTSESLVEPLKKMHLEDIFGPQSDLTGITSSTNLFVSEILQQATLEVDEMGTVAAAATSALLIPLSADSKPRPRLFTIDRPFLAIILDTENKSPLFVSKINIPQL